MDMELIRKWLVDHDWLILREVKGKGEGEARIYGLLVAVSPEGSLRTFKENPKGGIIAA